MAEKPKNLLIIGRVWPEPNSSAAGTRMMQLLKLFQEHEWDITFASAASPSEYSVDLNKLGIRNESIEINDTNFDSFIKNLNPQVVLFDRFMTEEQLGWRVENQCPDALRVLDTEDLHCLRAARYEAWKEGRSFRKTDLHSDIAKREIAAIWRCDLSLIISEFEINLLKTFYKVDAEMLMYLPFMLSKIDEQILKTRPDFNSRKNFLSIGNFLHEPNWNAVLFLKEEIWPLIRKQLPETELHIYGAYPSQKAMQLHNPKEGFLVNGRAESAKEVVGNARILLAPLRFGAGLKGKLIEAMQCGTPSVTTDIGAESINGEFPWPGAVSNDPVHFAQSAVHLYNDQRSWNKAQVKGVDIINNRFSGKETGEKLMKKISELLENLKTHRQNNFTGAMLQHHSLASTKYMSKWIELKNKNSD